MRHERLLRSYAVTHPPGPVRLPQDPGWHQFVYASSGVIRLETDAGTWVLPPHRALWIRAGVDHDATVVHRASVRTLYLPEPERLLDRRTAVVDVTSLVRELVLRIAQRAPVDLCAAEGRAWLTVLAAEVRTSDLPPLRLPAVVSGPARTVADLLRADPGRADTIDVLAAHAGATRRTVERQFRSEAGLSVGAWRRRLRLLRALEQLASGTPVSRVAVDAGYATQSAFGAMFRRELGTTPGSYVGQAVHAP